MKTYKGLSLTLLLSLPLFSNARNSAEEGYDVDSVTVDIDEWTARERVTTSPSTKPTTLEQVVQKEGTAPTNKPGIVETSMQKRERAKKEQEARTRQKEQERTSKEASRAAAAALALRKNQAFQELQDAQKTLTEKENLYNQAFYEQNTYAHNQSYYKHEGEKLHKLSLSTFLLGLGTSLTFPIVAAVKSSVAEAFEWTNDHPLIYVPFLLGSVAALIFERKSNAFQTGAQLSSDLVTSKKSEIEILGQEFNQAKQVFDTCQAAYDSLNN